MLRRISKQISPKKKTERPVANGEKRLRKKKKNPAEDTAASPKPSHAAKGKPTTGKIKLIKKGNKTVAEIDGELYAVDANGKPTKKLRKKKKPGEDDDEPPEQSPNGKNMRQPVRLQQSTEGEQKRRTRSHSANPRGEVERGRGRPEKDDLDTYGERRRTRSVGRDKKMQQDEERRRREKEAPGEMKREKSMNNMSPRTFVDARGRKVVVDEFGNKTVFDKNGKKLRKKGEKEEKKTGPVPVPVPVPVHVPNDDESVYSEGVGGGAHNIFDSFISPAVPKKSTPMSRASTFSGVSFDKLWDDGSSVSPSRGSREYGKSPMRRSSDRGGSDLGGIDEGHSSHDNGLLNDAPSVLTNGSSTDTHSKSQSLSAKISEYGKENRTLQLKLMAAEEQLHKLSELTKKEKAKSVKATSEMMQIKADFTEASSEVQNLRSKTKDLQQTIEAKESELANMLGAPPSPRHGRHASISASPRRMSRFVQLGESQTDGMDEKEMQEIEGLVSENSALQRKLEFEKQIAQTELKKKEDKMLFLGKELGKLRDELEMIIRGETKGSGKLNPTMVRLLEEKKAIESKYNQEQEITAIRVEGMQEMIEGLTKINGDLKKQLNSAPALGNSSTSLDLNNATGTGSGKPNVKKEMTGSGNPKNGKKEMTGFGNPNAKPPDAGIGNFFSKFRK